MNYIDIYNNNNNMTKKLTQIKLNVFFVFPNVS